MPPVKSLHMACLARTSIAYNENKIRNQRHRYMRKIISHVGKERPAALRCSRLPAGDVFLTSPLVATSCDAHGNFKICRCLVPTAMNSDVTGLSCSLGFGIFKSSPNDSN